MYRFDFLTKTLRTLIEERTVSSINDAGKTAYLISICRRMKLDRYPSSYTKINSKWIKHLNVKSKIMKVTEENIGEILQDIGLRKYYMNKT